MLSCIDFIGQHTTRKPTSDSIADARVSEQKVPGNDYLARGDRVPDDIPGTDHSIRFYIIPAAPSALFDWMQ